MPEIAAAGQIILFLFVMHSISFSLDNLLWAGSEEDLSARTDAEETKRT